MTVAAAILDSVDLFAEIPGAAPDPILGLTEAYNADTNPIR